MPKEQVPPLSILPLDSGKNHSACSLIGRIFRLPPHKAKEIMAQLNSEQNVLYVPFAVPLHMMVIMQQGNLEELPFYTAIFSSFVALDPRKTGITESMAANLLTARQMGETRKSVSRIVHEKIPAPSTESAQQIHTKLSQGRDIDMTADIDTSQMTNIIQRIVTNCINTYPHSQVISHDQNKTVIRTSSGELISITTGYFHEDHNNPFLHIQKGDVTIHFKPFEFKGIINPFDTISIDRAEVHISGNCIDTVINHPSQKLSAEFISQGVDEGYYFTNGKAMQGLPEYSESDMAIILGWNFLDFMGSPMKLEHKKYLVEGDTLYLSYPRTVARMIRKATDHEANLGTTIKGYYALKTLEKHRYATPAIDESDLRFLKKKGGKINRNGGLHLHHLLLKATIPNEVEETQASIGADLVAALIQNPGRMWRYFVGTEFYTLFPRFKSLSQEQINEIDTQLHIHDSQLDNLTEFAKNNHLPESINNELAYEELLRLITHPKARVWKSKNHQEELARFEHGINKLSRIIQKYRAKPEDQSDFDFVVSLFSL